MAANLEEAEEEVLLPVQEFQDWYDSALAIRKNNSQGLPYLRESTRLKDGTVKLELSFPVDDSEFVVFCPNGYPRISNVAVRAISPGIGKYCTSLNNFVNESRGNVKLASILTKFADHFNTSSSTSKQPVEKTLAVDSDFEDADSPDEEGNKCGENAESDPDEVMEDFNFTTRFDIEMDILKKGWWKKEKEMRDKIAQEKEKANPFFPSTSQKSSFANSDTKDAKVKEGEQIFEHESAAFQILSTEMIAFLKNGKAEGFDCSAVKDSLYKWDIKMNKFNPDCILSQELLEVEKKFHFNYIELQLDFIPDYPFYPPLLRIVRPRFKGSLVQSLASIDLLKLTYWNPAKNVRDVLCCIKDILIKHAKLDVANEKNDPKAFPDGAYLPLEDYLIKLALASEIRPRANYEIINVENLEKAPSLIQKVSSEPKKADSNGGGWSAGVGYGSGRRSTTWTPEAILKAEKEKEQQILSILSNIARELAMIKTQNVRVPCDLFSIVEGSALIAYFESLLNVFLESSIELSRRSELFKMVLEIMESLASIPCLLRLFCNLERQQYSIMVPLDKLKDRQVQLINVTRNSGALKKIKLTNQNQMPQEDLELSNAEKTIELFKFITHQLSAANLRYSMEAQKVVEAQNKNSKDQYVKCLTPLQYAANNFDVSFLYKDEDRFNLLRALIVGPVDTPYANGCFVFDVCFPVTYPEKPPLVTLVTTGGGKVRFNPNLYNNGKVCLSLLGTWNGDKGESWIPKSSTLLQVLISIQSLILVEQPYFNEPGYESTIGTPSGTTASESYNKSVRQNCVQLAMIDMIKNPPAGFEDVVKFHFKLKKEQVLEQVEKWASDDPDLKPKVTALKQCLIELGSVKLPV